MQLDRQESMTTKIESELGAHKKVLKQVSEEKKSVSNDLQEATEKLKSLEKENSDLKAKLQAKVDRESTITDNLYVAGNCTWYVKEKVPYVPNRWGNAKSWLASAQKSGFDTGSDPREGAIGVSFEGYYGHVVYVESINKDGSVTISEMNNSALGGLNIVSSRTVPSTSFQYIYA